VRRSFLIATLATMVVAAPAIAQSKTGFGPVVGINATTSSFGDYYGVGWMVGGQFVKGTGFGSVMFEVTYNGFSIDDELPGEGTDFSDDVNIWGFGLGPRFALGPFHVGALAAYYTEVDDFDIVPLASINIWKLDLGARYKGLLGDADWFGLTLSFHFGDW
jgi:hypothetical protein